MKEPILMCWSGGKDSAMALHELRRSGRYDVRALLTTVTEDYSRVSMHGVRLELLEAQARRAGLPLEVVGIPKDASNGDYERKMEDALVRHKGRGVRRVAFGDLFLEDIRAYREKNLAKVGMEGLFPLWLKPTDALARWFVAEGFGAYLSCVDTRALDRSFAGRAFDEQFLSDLPAGVDPCGENGEFHSFVFQGPIFEAPVECHVTHEELREPFCFREIEPGRGPGA